MRFSAAQSEELRQAACESAAAYERDMAQRLADPVDVDTHPLVVKARQARDARRPAERTAKRRRRQAADTPANGRPVSQLRERLQRLCAYCPNRALHGSTTCFAHRDLIDLDPAFNAEVVQKPDRRYPAKSAPAGLLTNNGG